MVLTNQHVRLWRSRADELRKLAITLEDESARLGVLRAARYYEAMAADAAAQVPASPAQKTILQA